jgi:hypothetical protein
MLMRNPASPDRAGTRFSRDPRGAVRHSLVGVETLLDLQRTHGNVFVQRLVLGKPSMIRTGRNLAAAIW